MNNIKNTLSMKYFNSSSLNIFSKYCKECAGMEKYRVFVKNLLTI